jgi:hypothetical protein
LSPPLPSPTEFDEGRTAYLLVPQCGLRARPRRHGHPAHESLRRLPREIAIEGRLRVVLDLELNLLHGVLAAQKETEWRAASFTSEKK